MVENSPDFVSLLDRDGRILFINRVESGYDRAADGLERVTGQPRRHVRQTDSTCRLGGGRQETGATGVPTAEIRREEESARTATAGSDGRSAARDTGCPMQTSWSPEQWLVPLSESFPGCEV